MSWNDPRILAGLGGVQPRPRPAHRSARYLLAAAGAAGFVAALTLVYAEMREMIRATGGSCASGGPFVVAHPCPAGSAGLLTLGIFGMIGSGMVFAGAIAWSRGPAMSSVLLMWSALFGALGYNFLSLHGGSTVSGVTFEVMAAAGLMPVSLIAAASLRRRVTARSADGPPPASG